MRQGHCGPGLALVLVLGLLACQPPGGTAAELPSLDVAGTAASLRGLQGPAHELMVQRFRQALEARREDGRAVETLRALAVLHEASAPDQAIAYYREAIAHPGPALVEIATDAELI